MSLEDETSTSQETIWNFDIDTIAGLTNAAGLTTISAHNIDGSRGSSPGSALSKDHISEFSRKDWTGRHNVVRPGPSFLLVGHVHKMTGRDDKKSSVLVLT
ncbi:hypothetical protein HOY80DRAFT_1032191 [Tuber brumale]|nr:hypothetical protein HOY80DRAFT_1032191 [Tuber brumale]